MHSEEGDQERVINAVHVIERLAGDDRFGGAWIDRTSEERPVLGVALVAPTQADVDAVQAAASEAGCRVEIRVARYSRTALLAVLEDLNRSELPDGALFSLGWDARYNAVHATLSRWDEDVVQWLRMRVPEEALLMDVHPGARAVAGTG